MAGEVFKDTLYQTVERAFWNYHLKYKLYILPNENPIPGIPIRLLLALVGVVLIMSCLYAFRSPWVTILGGTFYISLVICEGVYAYVWRDIRANIVKRMINERLWKIYQQLLLIERVQGAGQAEKAMNYIANLIRDFELEEKEKCMTSLRRLDKEISGWLEITNHLPKVRDQGSGVLT